jgi:predicted secreted protein
MRVAVSLCGLWLVIVLAALTGSSAAAPPATGPARIVPKEDISQPGTYRAGLWEYKLLVTSPGSKSEGLLGKLFFGGKAVPEPVKFDYYRTPWGEVQWLDEPGIPWGEHGWFARHAGAKGGRLLAEPWIEAGGPVVMALVLQEAAEAPKGEVVLPWVKTEMEKLGVKSFKIARDWFPLNDQAVTIEDTKLVGRLTARLLPAREAETLTVLVDGTQTAQVPLARKDGANALVRRSLGGMMGTVNFYLALRVDRAAAGFKPLEVGAESDGKEVVVKGVREVVISLPGDKDSGCVWVIKGVQGDAPTSSSVQASGEAQFNPALGAAAGATRKGAYENVLRVMGTGKSWVELEYRRPWQTDQPAEKTFKVTLDVQEVPATMPAKP